MIFTKLSNKEKDSALTEGSCFHCGNNFDNNRINYNDKSFCCNGCKTVYEILNAHNLGAYYELSSRPGSTPENIKDKYNYLENEKIALDLYDFKDKDHSIITFYLPNIHCSSCIWVLENLNTLNSGVKSSQVNFPKKEVQISFNSSELSLKELVLLLGSIGYEPLISLAQAETNKSKKDRSLLYKIAVAGFGFGNIMLLSFPEYFQSDGYWLEKYKPLFNTLMFLTVLPVVFYSANTYFISAYKGLKNKLLNIDVPIALGILVLFLRSSFEFFFNHGQGYFDSLAGFVFFLLLGSYFQERTYQFLSFERDFRSYFPMAVTRIKKDRSEEQLAVGEIKKGQRLLIRNKELIPIDAILISGDAQIDYSFVTGEALPVNKSSGAQVYAGGKQLGGAIEIEVLKTMSQSYLTQLWTKELSQKSKSKNLKNITDSISKQFTIVILLIALISGIVWAFIDMSMIANVVTAVLIIACPCALALSAPFALGNMLRIFGRNKIYLKNVESIEKMAAIDTIIFDKTGTITNSLSQIEYKGIALSHFEKQAVRSALRASNHPLSRMLYKELKSLKLLPVTRFKETVGHGIQAKVDGLEIKLGKATFVNAMERTELASSIFLSINNSFKGQFLFKNSYRTGLKAMLKNLSRKYQLGILSGDNQGELDNLAKLVPKNTPLVFDQKPKDKLNYIKKLQKKGNKVLMIGDGLNDAGALVQSDLGLVISENINVFSPASDGIIDASQFLRIPKLLKSSKTTLNIIKVSFVLSFLYNLIGMSFAVTGNLTPIVAAILMPLSSITIVIFVTLSTNLLARSEKFDKT